MTANRLSPAASSTSIGVVNRHSHRLNRKAIEPPAAVTARYRQSTKVAGGRAPSNVSRMMPPPRAVMMPKVITPTTSRRAVRTAVNAPFNANANVPSKSNTNGAEVSPGTGRVYRIVHLRN